MNAVGATRQRSLLAVAIHDVEPATFERCALMRDWLDDLGVTRVTLLLIPAPRLHPFPARSPELANWLLDRVDAGDAVAQHGRQSTTTHALRTTSALKRAASPALVRAAAALSGDILRLDLHPADFDHPRHVLAVQRVLTHARDRTAVTCDDLFSRTTAGVAKRT